MFYSPFWSNIKFEFLPLFSSNLPTNWVIQVERPRGFRALSSGKILLKKIRLLRREGGFYCLKGEGPVFPPPPYPYSSSVFKFNLVNTLWGAKSTQTEWKTTQTLKIIFWPKMIYKIFFLWNFKTMRGFLICCWKSF